MKKINEVAPPKWSGTVKAMKKHKEIDNPYALSWYMKNKGDKAHYKPMPKDSTKSPGEPKKKKGFKEWLGEAVIVESDVANDPRIGCVCPHCGSTKTHGARAIEHGKNGKWTYANTACGACDNGFGFNFETNMPVKQLSDH